MGSSLRIAVTNTPSLLDRSRLPLVRTGVVAYAGVIDVGPASPMRSREISDGYAGSPRCSSTSLHACADWSHAEDAITVPLTDDRSSRSARIVLTVTGKTTTYT